MRRSACGRRSTVREAAAAVVLLAAIVGAAPRWLRVAQREHYLPGSVLRFWWRWMHAGPLNLLVGSATVVLGAASGFVAWPLAFAAAVGLVVWPIGLGIRGRTSPLAWTRRLRTLAVVAALASVVTGVALSFLLGFPEVAGIFAVSVPLIVDKVLVLTAPIEARASRRFVRDAVRRVDAVRPRIVAITGSYGKTSTKEHVRDLISGQLRVVASPASFNNEMGLARTVNEALLPGTEVLIAEMGTYGPGEIAAMCGWLPPDIAVITAIGPVHLERFGSLEQTLTAKAEITHHAPTVVLNVDCPLLATLATDLHDKRIVRCGSSSESADVFVVVERGELVCRAGAWAATVPAPHGVNAANVACALGVALELGVEHRVLEQGLRGLHAADHRGVLVPSPSGVQIVDDTFSSNPAGASAAIERIGAADVAGRRVVVTPGMVELGVEQQRANVELGELAGGVADVVVVVGRTNRGALLEGVRAAGQAQSVAVRTREDAVRWVREHSHDGDLVLYENDLPDHYA
jgi:UDP-N-acetylmuramoyl-tripeptide--D-alanyl-D-alanine ligase